MRKSRTNADPLSVVCHLTILAVAILLPVLLISCGEKNQTGETQTGDNVTAEQLAHLMQHV